MIGPSYSAQNKNDHETSSGMKSNQSSSNNFGTRTIISDHDKFSKFTKTFNVEKAQFILDFDHTITKPSWMLPNESARLLCGGSSFGVIENLFVFSEQQLQNQYEMTEKYYAMEQDFKYDEEKKEELFYDWWKNTFVNIENSKLSKKTLDESITHNCSAQIKEKFHDFLNFINGKIGLKLDEAKLIIFSAGIANVIQELFKRNSIDYEKFKIISNELDLKTRKLINQKMITSHSKTSSSLNQKFLNESTEWFIVIGDSTTDHRMLMDTHVPQNSQALKIGLLNFKEFENEAKLVEAIDAYSKLYDVVIVNDSDFEPVLNLFLNPLKF